MKKIYFIIGASGSGKTVAAKALEKMSIESLKFYYFDSIGVPSPDEMNRNWGSGEEWQRATTIEWVRRMKSEESDYVVLDGQTRPSFISEACNKNTVENYKIILVDCSDEIRKARLISRGHPELANEQMMNWAKFLRIETEKQSGTIINNDSISVEGTAMKIKDLILNN